MVIWPPEIGCLSLTYGFMINEALPMLEKAIAGRQDCCQRLLPQASVRK
jgi:hypothetical protein